MFLIGGVCTVLLDHILSLEPKKKLLVGVKEKRNENIKIPQLGKDADTVKFILDLSFSFMVKLNFPFLHCDNIACVSPCDTASADKSDDLVPHKLHVVKESHLKTPSVPKIGLNLLDCRWLGMLQIVNNLLLDILDHPLNLLMRTSRLLLVVLLPRGLTQTLSCLPQIVVRYAQLPLRHIQVAIRIIVVLVNLLDLVELAHQL